MSQIRVQLTSQAMRFEKISLALKNNEIVVIPDLQSKRTLQELGLNVLPVLADDRAPRSREFWTSIQKELVRAALCDVQFLPRKIILLELEDWVSQQNIPWAKTNQSVRTLVDVMDIFIDLIADEQKFSALCDWLRDHTTSLKRWFHWIMLARQAFLYLSQKFYWSETWLKDYLVIHQIENIKNQFTDGIYHFDLGPVVDDSELELISALSSTNQVFYYAEDFSEVEPTQHQISLNRYEHELLEKRDLVLWVKEQILSYPIGHITVVTPSPKSDRLLIDSLLIREGLVSQSNLGPLMSIPAFRKWALQLLSRFVAEEYDQLEILNFSDILQPRQKFSEFYSSTWTVVKDHNRRAVKSKTRHELSFQDFLFSEVFKDGAELPIELGNIIHRSCLLIPTELKLKPQRWAQFLVSEVGDALSSSKKSISVIDYDSLLYLPQQQVYFCQLSEEVFQPQQFFRLIQDERFKLKKDLGWLVKGSQFLNRRHLMQNALHKASGVATFFETDVRGSKHAPSLFFLENYDSERQKKLSDASSSKKSFPWVEEYLLNQTASQPVKSNDFSLSASALEQYLKCPFLFKADKLFRLRDLDQLSVEVSARNKGSLLHKLAQEFSGHLDCDEKLITEKVRAVIDSQGTLVYDDWFKENLVQTSIRWVKRFLQVEKDNAAVTAEYAVAGHEIEFSGLIDVVNKKIVAASSEDNPDQNHWKFTGRIDRLEKASDNRFKVVDYKTKHSGQTHGKSWLENDQLQLLLYSLAIENGLTAFGKGSVEAAIYYFLEPLERSRGLVLQGVAEPHISEGSKVEASVKESLITEAMSKITDVIKLIEEGKFLPVPKKTRDCDRCAWRDLCRAPHLN